MTSQVSMFFSTCGTFSTFSQNAMSLDENKFFIISQSLVTQFIFSSTFNHICFHEMKQVREGKKLRNLLSLIFELCVFQCFSSVGRDLRLERRIEKCCDGNRVRKTSRFWRKT